jgi:hypothetical protein
VFCGTLRFYGTLFEKQCLSVSVRNELSFTLIPHAPLWLHGVHVGNFTIALLSFAGGNRNSRDLTCVDFRSDRSFDVVLIFFKILFQWLRVPTSYTDIQPTQAHFLSVTN